MSTSALNVIVNVSPWQLEERMEKRGKERKKFVSLSGGGNGASLYWCHLRIASNASIDIHCFIVSGRLSATTVGTDTLPPVPLRWRRVNALNNRIRLNFALLCSSLSISVLFPASNSVELALMQRRGMSGKKEKRSFPFFSPLLFSTAFSCH